MKILYTGDNEGPAVMELETLIANFNESGGWQFRHNETDMRHELASRGYYEGLHENGHYLALNLDKFGLVQRAGMTFEQFQASRRDCDDLRNTIHASFFEDYAAPATGFLYAGDLFIEKIDGEFALTLGNESRRSDDLTALERDLYEYGVGEGVFD